MRRLRRVLLVLAALVGLAWATGPWVGLSARFGPEDCRRLDLVDAGTGAPLAGIEDIAPYAGWLFLSVDDRLAAERAAAEGRPVPEGGIYRLPVDRLGEAGPVALVNEAAGLPGAIHPHGIHASLGKLVAINRGYGPRGAAGRKLRVFAIRDGGLEQLYRLPQPGLCAANDLELTGVEVRLTLDRADCPGLSLREAVWPRGTGRLVRMGATDRSGEGLGEIETGLVYANGLASVEWGRTSMLVAETRARRVVRLGAWPAGEAPPRTTLPGAPDNLVPDDDGGVIAAVHPSLVRLGLYRGGWTGSAPSRILRLTADGEVEVLYDDLSGALLSGATVGVRLADGRLVAGSVRDAGLLLCGD